MSAHDDDTPDRARDGGVPELRGEDRRLPDATERLLADLEAVVASAGRGLPAANQLCHACVKLFDVDGAAISPMHQGTTRGTFGSSGELSRRLDEFQFTLGEGPCLEAVAQGQPVLIADLAESTRQHWPAFVSAVLDSGVRAVFAFPVAIAAAPIGSLDLFRHRPGSLSPEQLAGCLRAAELAALPLLDLMSADVDWSSAAEGGEGWAELASLERVEVYQATGMMMAQLDVDARAILLASITAGHPRWANPAYPRRGRGRENTR